MFRDVKLDDLNHVSGGTEVVPGGIIVTGMRRLPGEDNADEWRMRSSFAGDSVGDWLYSAGQYIADRIENFFGSDLETDAEKMAAAEKAISEKFNNTTVESTKNRPDGTVEATGKDGWTYVDTDGNGVFDQRMRVNKDGSLTVDFGITTSVFRS